MYISNFKFLKAQSIEIVLTVGWRLSQVMVTDHWPHHVVTTPMFIIVYQRHKIGGMQQYILSHARETGSPAETISRVHRQPRHLFSLYTQNKKMNFSNYLSLGARTLAWKLKTSKIKNPRPLRAAFDRECFLIVGKHTEILDCIPCVMVFLLHSASRAQISTATWQTHKRTDGRYQTYYLPGFAVDN